MAELENALRVMLGLNYTDAKEMASKLYYGHIIRVERGAFKFILSADNGSVRVAQV